MTETGQHRRYNYMSHLICMPQHIKADVWLAG